jgi:hypothetical protein
MENDVQKHESGDTDMENDFWTGGIKGGMEGYVVLKLCRIFWNKVKEIRMVGVYCV